MQTMEGGSLQSYEREITSDQQQRSQVSAKVRAVNTPVQIGVDAEQSRSYSYSRRAVGTKIINRTISFRVGFRDAPRSSASLEDAIKEAAVDLDPTPPFKFEEEMCRWILDRVKLRRARIGQSGAQQQGVQEAKHTQSGAQQQGVQQAKQPGAQQPDPKTSSAEYLRKVIGSLPNAKLMCPKPRIS